MTIKKREEIKLFDGTIFHIWKFHMYLCFVEKALWSIVTRDELVSATATAQLEKDTWNKRNFIAKKMISSFVIFLILENLVNCTTTKCMWSTLYSLHQQKTKENIYMLNKKSLIIECLKKTL